jgi:hybrid cluster-associated redox disulfide protein
MSADTISNMTVGEVMARWPQSVPVFLRRGMSCPGCLMARFMTVADAAAAYGIAADELPQDLLRAIAAAPEGQDV